MIFDNSIPIYLQIIELIKKDLVTGSISPGEKLPSTRDLASKYSINPNTAARIYRELEFLGLCYTKRGLGTFAIDSEERIESLRNEMATQMTDQFITGMLEIGFSHETIIEIIKNKGVNKS